MGVIWGNNNISGECSRLKCCVAAYCCILAAAAIKLQHILYLSGTDRNGLWQCIYAIIMLKRMLETAKSQKELMLQHAAAYVQHSGRFAAHSINLVSVHVMEWNMVSGCFFRWQVQFQRVFAVTIRYCSIQLLICCCSSKIAAYMVFLWKLIKNACSNANMQWSCGNGY